VEAAFQRQALLRQFLILPLLRLNEPSGEKSTLANKLGNWLRPLNPLPCLDNRFPRFRPYRVNLRRRLLVKLLSLGLQTLLSLFLKR
jgi:hypothetical protein